MYAIFADCRIFTSDNEANNGQNFAAPSGIYFSSNEQHIASFSVKPVQRGKFYAEFLTCGVNMMSAKSMFSYLTRLLKNCAVFPARFASIVHCAVIQAVLKLYSCDRYAFPSYYLGNILNTNLEKLMVLNKEFGCHKIYGLPDHCFNCEHMKLCSGGCPKDRLKSGENYLCEGYRLFFSHFYKILSVTY